jgi:hypothetical protein
MAAGIDYAMHAVGAQSRGQQTPAQPSGVAAVDAAISRLTSRWRKLQGGTRHGCRRCREISIYLPEKQAKILTVWYP